MLYNCYKNNPLELKSATGNPQDLKGNACAHEPPCMSGVRMRRTGLACRTSLSIPCYAPTAECFSMHGISTSEYNIRLVLRRGVWGCFANIWNRMLRRCERYSKNTYIVYMYYILRAAPCCRRPLLVICKSDWCLLRSPNYWAKKLQNETLHFINMCFFCVN